MQLRINQVSDSAGVSGAALAIRNGSPGSRQTATERDLAEQLGTPGLGSGRALTGLADFSTPTAVGRDA
jgi:hypothetical protein